LYPRGNENNNQEEKGERTATEEGFLEAMHLLQPFHKVETSRAHPFPGHHLPQHPTQRKQGQDASEEVGAALDIEQQHGTEAITEQARQDDANEHHQCVYGLDRAKNAPAQAILDESLEQRLHTYHRTDARNTYEHKEQSDQHHTALHEDRQVDNQEIYQTKETGLWQFSLICLTAKSSGCSMLGVREIGSRSDWCSLTFLMEQKKGVIESHYDVLLTGRCSCRLL
jgi:hypothetical protein